MNPSPNSVLIAIATSTQRCAVALRPLAAKGGGVLATADTLDELPQRGHSGHVLSMIRRLLDRADLRPAQIGAVAFDAGPGAFTGLRIGCGVAQGLGYAVSCPLIPVGSLEAIATQAGPGDVAVAIDARMGEVYAAWIRVGADRDALALAGPVVASPAAAAIWFDEMLVRLCLQPSGAAGDAFALHPALATWAQARSMPPHGSLWPTAEAIAVLGRIALLAGRGVDPQQAAPRYVRDKVALDVDEQARARTEIGRAHV